jgi:prepilin-type N-terminal cleavage/methylation domain-containing protein
LKVMRRFLYRKLKMKWDSKNNTLRRKAFTMIEVSVALIILGMITATVLVIINKAVDTVVFWQAKMQAFEIARENMEQLLSRPSVTDVLEYGTSQTNPDINWETTIESFYEPVTNRMWMRAVCAAEFTDTQGQPQKIELTQWLTGLNKKQVFQILDQRRREKEYQQAMDEYLDETSSDLQDDQPPEQDPQSQQDAIAQSWKEIESWMGPPPEGYDHWGQVPEEQFWTAVMATFRKK